jgi:membrane associated rhomboid family serine protease
MSFFKSIWDDLNYSMRAGNMVTKLVVANFAVFVVANLVYVLLWMFHFGSDVGVEYWDTINYLCISADWHKLLWRPWTIVTHFFLHVGLWHLVNNVFGLYLFGSIVSDLVGERRILPLYLMGGLAGALFFFVSANISASFGDYALGASAAVMAMAGAAITLAPEYRIPLLLIGEVKVKYIVLVFVLLDLVGIASSSFNAGGHVAHLGGFVMGIFFVFRLRDGKDMAEPFNDFFSWVNGLFTPSARKTKQSAPKRKIKTAIRATMSNTGGSASSDRNDLSHQERLDAILEKIKDSGYENLSQSEKDFLYDASKK